MSRIISHIPETYYFDKDFSLDVLPEILSEAARYWIGDSGYFMDLTTIQGDYHYDISFESLSGLLHQYKEIVNSITLSEVRIEMKGEPKSIVIYLNTSPGNHDISATVSSGSEDDNSRMVEYILKLIRVRQKEFQSETSEQLNDSFRFDQYFPANRITAFFEKVSRQFMADKKANLEVLTYQDELHELGEENYDKLKNIIRKGDHHIISFSKAGLKGSYLNISLYYEKETAGFCYLSMATGKRHINEFIRKMVRDDLEMAKEEMVRFKTTLLIKPQLQGIFHPDPKLNPDQIVDSIEELSSQFLSREALTLRLITPARSLYCYAENQCDDLRSLFRQNKEGVLFARKSDERGHTIILNFQFTSWHQLYGYYYVALRSQKENETVRDFLLNTLGKRENDIQANILIRPQLQEAFSFNQQIQAKELVSFLNALSEKYLQEEIVAVRLTTIKGEKYYFYDEDYSELIGLISKGVHDIIYISLKEPEARSISIHLQFKSHVAGSNGYYSIIMNDEEENFSVRDFILGSFKSKPALAGRKSVAKNTIPDSLTVQAEESTFKFNQFISTASLLSFFGNLGSAFLPGHQMTVRIMTRNQEEYFFLESQTSRLKYIFQSKDIDYLYIQKGTKENYKLSLYLQFGDTGDQTGYYSVFTPSREENIRIKSLILGNLAAGNMDNIPDGLKKVSGKFTFPRDISADLIIAFMNALVRQAFPKAKFVKNKRLNFNLRTTEGQAFSNLDYNIFRKIFTEEKKGFHLLSVSAITTAGEFVEIAFLFNPNQKSPEGNYIIQCGNEDLNEEIRDFIKNYFSITSVPKKLMPLVDKKAFVSVNTKTKTGQNLSAEITQLLKDINIDCIEPQAPGSLNVIESILSSIKESDILILDLSGKRADIFYQLGLAQSMQKNLILLSNNSADLPYDLKQFEHIFYNNTKKGRTRLMEELKLSLNRILKPE